MARQKTGLSVYGHRYLDYMGRETTEDEAVITLFRRRDVPSENWYARLKVKRPNADGYRIYPKVSLGTGDEAAAIENARKMLEDRKDDLRTGIEHSHGKRFKHLCKEWLSDRKLAIDRKSKEEPFTHRQEKALWHRLEHFEHVSEKYLNADESPLANLHPRQIKTADLIKWKAWRGTKIEKRKEGGKEWFPTRKTIDYQLWFIRRVLMWGAERGWLPMTSIPSFPWELRDEMNRKRRKYKLHFKRRDAYTDDEIRLMLDKLPEWLNRSASDGDEVGGLVRRDRAMMAGWLELLIATGARPGDFLSLRCSELKETEITMQGGEKLRRYRLFARGKENDREITCAKPLPFLDAWLCNEAKGRNADTDFVFCRPNGKQLADNPHQAFRAFIRWINEQESKSLPTTVYSIRHWFITRKITSGSRLDCLAEHCGTSESMIKLHYNHLDKYWKHASIGDESDATFTGSIPRKKDRQPVPLAAE